jgi:hypothetical protein
MGLLIVTTSEYVERQREIILIGDRNMDGGYAKITISSRTYEKLSVQVTFANTLYASMPLSKAIHGFRRFAKVTWTLSFS